MKLRLHWILAGLLGAASPPFVMAQGAPAADTSDATADAAYSRQDWPKTEELYGALVKSNAKNGRYWFRLGKAQRGNGHYEAALASFEKARTLGANKGLPGYMAHYEVASTLAASGDEKRALERLKAAADGGYSQADRIDKDGEWSALRGDPQFAALVKQIHHNAAPCEDAEFRQFDFWVGDWDVVQTGNTTAAGTSHISKEMGGCVVWENWTSAGVGGYFGKSYNTYNVNLHRWEQYWVDNSAGTIFFYGGLKDGVMDYWTDDVPQPNGEKLRRHLQFFALGPDKVRQFSQGSKDGGKTWAVEYDLTYNRRSSKDTGTR
jgi:tetratricopeptide (TPR) repeat protein